MPKTGGGAESIVTLHNFHIGISGAPLRSGDEEKAHPAVTPGYC